MVITETTVLMRVGEKERVEFLTVYLPLVDYEMKWKSLLFLAWRSEWGRANKRALDSQCTYKAQSLNQPFPCNVGSQMPAIHCRHGPFPPHVPEVSQTQEQSAALFVGAVRVAGMSVSTSPGYFLSCDLPHTSQVSSSSAPRLCWLHTLWAELMKYPREPQAGIATDGWEM